MSERGCLVEVPMGFLHMIQLAEDNAEVLVSLRTTTGVAEPQVCGDCALEVRNRDFQPHVENCRDAEVVAGTGNELRIVGRAGNDYEIAPHALCGLRLAVFEEDDAKKVERCAEY